MDSVATSKPFRRSTIHPLKFALWVGCASIAMVFFALTSAIIIREAQGNWLEFQLPNIFFLSTGIILLSSIALHSSYRAYTKGNETMYKWLLVAAFVLGIGFLITQYQGWMALGLIGVNLKENASGDFLYALSGLHAAHILGGLAALAVGMINAFSLKYKITPARKLRFELSLTYWHFVDFLWIYLFVFFLLIQS